MSDLHRELELVALDLAQQESRLGLAEPSVIWGPSLFASVRCPVAINHPLALFTLKPLAVGIVTRLLAIAASARDPEIARVLRSPVRDSQRWDAVLDVQLSRVALMATTVEAETAWPEQRVHDRNERLPVELDQNEAIPDRVAKGACEIASECFGASLDCDTRRIGLPAMVTDRLLSKATVCLRQSADRSVGRFIRVPVEILDWLPSCVVLAPRLVVRCDLAPAPGHTTSPCRRGPGRRREPTKRLGIYSMPRPSARPRKLARAAGRARRLIGSVPP